MDALSLWQPWATLVAIGAKRYETRSWRPNRPLGPLAIHATKTFPREAMDLRLQEPFRGVLAAAGYLKPADLPIGAVLAVVEVEGFIPTREIRDWLSDQEREFGDYSNNRWAWKFGVPSRFREPIATRGYQNIWTWDPPVDWADLLIRDAEVRHG